METRVRCRICQYVHEGDKAPKRCPWCSVGPNEFEKIDDVGNTVTTSPNGQSGLWYCSVCNAECHEGTYEEIAEDWLCPECGSWKELLKVK